MLRYIVRWPALADSWERDLLEVERVLRERRVL